MDQVRRDKFLKIPDEALPDADGQLAVRAWNLMGGLDWSALPLIVELLGVQDPETLILNLTTIRDHNGR